MWHSATARAVYDFDGDGKTDPTVWRVDQTTSQLIWFSLRSRDGFMAAPWGAVAQSLAFEDKAVPEDYDGDGKWDLAVWRRHVQEEGQSYFFILFSSTNTYQAIPWGLRYDLPIPQDYDGDGKADVAVARYGSQTEWYIVQSRDGYKVELFGVADPVRGDYDGDGKADLATVSRGPGRGDYRWRVRFSSDGSEYFETFGYAQADFVAPADYDGDGKTDIAVWRGASEYGNGTWYWHKSSDGGFGQLKWGTTYTPDYMVQGDYDGDGKTDIAIYRRGSLNNPPSYFYILGSRYGFKAIQWGDFRDAPLNQ